jgi:hypothetical protein
MCFVYFSAVGVLVKRRVCQVSDCVHSLPNRCSAVSVHASSWNRLFFLFKLFSPLSFQKYMEFFFFELKTHSIFHFEKMP